MIYLSKRTYDMAYGDFKDSTRATASDKILHNKAFNIAKNPKYDGYKRGLASMVYKFFNKKTSGGTVTNENISSKELAQELQKPIIKKFKERKVHSSFIYNIWGADPAKMQLISKFNKCISLLVCVIDIFIKYAWVIHLNDKKGITITNAFEIFFKESNPKPNKIWVDKGRRFYNRSMKPWIEKSVVPERFIRILKNKIYKYMTSI